MRDAATGISAHLGWAATATIVVDEDGIRVLRSDRLEVGSSGDREIHEPYHVAGGFEGLTRVPQPADPERALARGLKRQRREVARCVSRQAASLAKDGYRCTVVGLLVSRGKAAESFERAIGSHTQIHVEEGIAIRESFRLAFEAAGAQVETIDQKALGSLAGEALGRPEDALRAELRAQRPAAGGPWRKEGQSAALAAWLAWHVRTERRGRST